MAASKKPIRIKPANRGKLTKKVGKKGLTTSALSKEKTAAKKSGNTKLEKEIVFAQNAKKWKH
jgi:hypothetical protein